MRKLLFVLSMCAILLLAACGEVVSTIAPAATAPTTSAGVTQAMLDYPGANWLKEEQLKPEGRPEDMLNSKWGGFITGDSKAKVREYYTQKLVKLGYQIGTNYGCLSPSECINYDGFEALLQECVSDGTHTSCGAIYQINFWVLEGKITPEERQTTNLSDTLYPLFAPDKTLVGFTYNTVANHPQIVLNPTTAAAVPTLTPEPKK